MYINLVPITIIYTCPCHAIQSSLQFILQMNINHHSIIYLISQKKGWSLQIISILILNNLGNWLPFSYNYSWTQLCHVKTSFFFPPINWLLCVNNCVVYKWDWCWYTAEPCITINFVLIKTVVNGGALNDVLCPEVVEQGFKVMFLHLLMASLEKLDDDTSQGHYPQEGKLEDNSLWVLII